MKSLSMLVAFAAGALLLGAFLTAQSVHAQAPAGTGNATRGKAAFMKNGCYQCHGTLGQGNYGAGPAIAPNPMPYANFIGYIRAPRGAMPPFDEHILSASDAQDIYAYLASIPTGPPSGQIDALKSVTFGNAGSPPQLSAAELRGKRLFSGACMKCHGADGASPVIGPALVNEKAKKNLDAVIAQIKNPAQPMPKLYPSPFNDQDVSDIAAYVETL
ncbi:MAG TPA: c-type cytochrome [Candidatus Binatia bacterium]|nr:c-type cytochrome [Candidatus Binatia bacterium]